MQRPEPTEPSMSLRDILSDLERQEREHPGSALIAELGEATLSTVILRRQLYAVAAFCDALARTSDLTAVKLEAGPLCAALDQIDRNERARWGAFRALIESGDVEAAEAVAAMPPPDQWDTGA